MLIFPGRSCAKIPLLLAEICGKVAIVIFQFFKLQMSFCQKLRTNLQRAAERFPLLLASNFALGAIVVFLIWQSRAADFPILQKLAFVGVLNFPLFLAAELFIENHKINSRKILGIDLDRIVANVVAVAFSAIYFLVLPAEFANFNGAHFLQFVLILFGFAVGVVVAPFVGRKDCALALWQFGERLVVNFAVAFFFSLAFLIGAIMCFAALDFLFDLSRVGDWIATAAMVLATLGGPGIFLSRMPHEFSKRGSAAAAPALQNLAKFVIVPFLIFYGGILLVYFLKILISQDWPTGGIANLLLIFLLALFAANFVFFPQRDALVVSRFRGVSFVAIFPAVAMLFVAVGWRVVNFGFTENRVLLLLFGAWFLLVAFAFLWRARLKIIFTTLFAAALVAAAGIFPFCKWHQSVRLAQVLQSINFLHGKFQATDPNSFQQLVQKAGENFLRVKLLPHRAQPRS